MCSDDSNDIAKLHLYVFSVNSYKGQFVSLESILHGSDELMKIQVFIYILTFHVRYNTGLIIFLTYLILLFGAFSPVYSLGNQDNVRVEIIKPWFDIYSETPIIPIKLFVDNNDNISKAMKIEVVSKYIGDRSEITKENQESFTVDPLSGSNITTHTDNLFEGKWLTEIRINSSNNEVYNDSFFLEIIPFSKWVSTNAIPLTAIVSSSIAILAVILQYQNSKDTQKNMKKQIDLLDSEIDLNRNRMIEELRPWISNKIEKGIGEYNISEELNRVTLLFSNFGKTPARNVKLKRKIIYYIPNASKKFEFNNMFDFQIEGTTENIGHIMPGQEIQVTYERKRSEDGTLLVNEFEYEYFTKKSVNRLVVSIINQEQKDSLRAFEYEYSN